jgi:hypothetical protein
LLLPNRVLWGSAETARGQPSTYWRHPSTVNEGTMFFGLFWGHSWWAYLCMDVVYLSVFLFLVSVIPRNTALIVAFSFILGHYYGASTWLSHRWHFTASGPIVYGIVLSVIIVRIVWGDSVSNRSQITQTMTKTSNACEGSQARADI